MLAAAAKLFATRGFHGTTMAAVAAEAGVAKPTLYHYVRDKEDLLWQIASGHVERLEALVADVHADVQAGMQADVQAGMQAEVTRGVKGGVRGGVKGGDAAPAGAESAARARLERLVVRFASAYASARHEHRVLTEDVKFLPEARWRTLRAAQKRVVAAFADEIATLRPDLAEAGLATAVAMLLLGSINWTFTWFEPGGALTREALGPLVAQLFFGGLAAVPPHGVPPGAAVSAPLPAAAQPRWPPPAPPAPPARRRAAAVR
jgi:TetR/AcrR family transcriptional regulator